MQPDGILLVAHQQLSRMSEAQLAAALPEAWRGLPRRHLPLVLEPRPDARDVEWDRAWRQQQRWHAEVFLPALQAHPTWTVAYFGAAHISLVLGLGALLGRRSVVWSGHHDHATRQWGWADDGPPLAVTVSGAPRDPIALAGPVILRVGASRVLDAAGTREVVPGAIAEIDLCCDPVRTTPFHTPAQLDAMVSAFDRVVRDLERTRPGATGIHLFVAGPPSLCCRLGAHLRPNETPEWHFYQRVRTHTPPYQRVLTLRGREAAPPTFSPTEQAAARQALGWWEDERQRLLCFAAEVAARPGSWLAALGVDAPLPPRHAALDRLDQLGALSAPLSTSWRDDIDGFRYDAVARRWWLTEALMVGLVRRLGDESRLRRAARLFFLHEGIHLRAQRLTGTTSPGAGRRHPELIEVLDDLADTWALMHELVLQEQHDGAALGAAVDDLLETLWAFDDGDGPVVRMQRRRLRRYLAWGWKRLELSRCPPGRAAAWRCLSERPLVSLAGLESYVDLDGRLLLRLDQARPEALEFAALSGGAIVWGGARGAAPLHALVEAVRARSTPRLLAALQIIFEQHHPA